MSHVTAQLLKERHSLDPGEAEHILGSFVDTVENQLEEYGICHVSGIGTFVRAPGDRKISFEPAEPLLRAVNVRFADLPVYEVDQEETAADAAAAALPEDAEARPEKPAVHPAPHAIEQVPPQSEQEQPAEQEPISESSAVAAAESSADLPDDPVQPEPTVDPRPAAEPTTEPPAPPAEPEAEHQSGLDAEQQPEPEPGPEPVSAEAPDSPSRPSVLKSRSPRSLENDSSRGRRAIWFALPLVIALAAAGVWYLQRSENGAETNAGEQLRAEQSAEPAVPSETDANGGATVMDDSADGTSAAAGGTPAQQQPDTAPETEADDPEPPTQPAMTDDLPEYPLDRSVDGYTMIVGSSPDRAAADEQMSRFSELDMPFGVLDYSEEESSMYRLALGLYDSAQQADSARQAMTDVLPSGTWVWRIR